MKYINFYNREMLTIIDTSCNYFGSNDINYINSRKNSDLITFEPFSRQSYTPECIFI